MAGDFDLSDGDWEETALARERKAMLRHIENMRAVTEYGQYEAGWNDVLTRLAEWVRSRQ